MSDNTSTPSRAASPTTGTPDIPPIPTDTTPARPYRFTWDPSASRRQGPSSVSETTEGRGGRGEYHFGVSPRVDLFGVSASSSTQLAQGALPLEWSSSKHGFHAISTVLNNPHKKQAPPKAHSSLPSVTPADLPRVRRKDFDSYLRAVAPEWERFEHNSQLGREQLDAAEDVSVPAGRAIPSLDVVPRGTHIHSL
ncbi:hypothetical protein PILCRDRAFT_16564 [Piloderma croceum F 1598]|uniref:Uncharacterized protein n=1 Tax=Piloderma croceum (strain F 1598) TaxID=765440 RepID=A0A0C3B3W7_PILCF|nr:hypothetical protein PILCRDRAFT_16564 [Piloderma croceum F 1598]